MTSTSSYDKIGPFKNVPEAERARIASVANRAAERASDAALRAALEAGAKAHGKGIVRPSAAAVTSAWSKEDEHARRYGMQALVETLFLLAICSVLAFPSLASLVDWYHGRPGALFGAFLLAMLPLAFAIWVYFIAYRKTLKDWRAVRRLGHADDALSHAVGTAAGKVWLLGQTGIVIGWADQDEFSTTRAVFYDAIGNATLTVENGLEGVTIWTRDGSFIDRIAKPDLEGGAQALVEAVQRQLRQFAVD
jgi:MFS family permease